MISKQHLEWKPKTAVQDVEARELRVELEAVLARCHPDRARITGLRRRPSIYCSSFALEEVDVHFEDGSCLQLMFKNLGWDALLEQARRVKPAFVYDPLREIGVYQLILSSRDIGTARFLGRSVDRKLARYWLFLERVPAPKLKHVGEWRAWQEAARWLGRMHASFAGEIDAPLQPAVAHLLLYDADYFQAWMRRAQAFLRQVRPSRPARHIRRFDAVAARYDEVIASLTALPTTLIHGDFFAGNVLIQDTPAGQRTCAVDWEMAGLGTGLIDLAALTAGTWTEQQKNALARAYYEALPARGPLSLPMDQFLYGLKCCRLHLAVQCLGWSTNWSPPPDEAQNWLDEALRMAEALGY